MVPLNVFVTSVCSKDPLLGELRPSVGATAYVRICNVVVCMFGDFGSGELSIYSSSSIVSCGELLTNFERRCFCVFMETWQASSFFHSRLSCSVVYLKALRSPTSAASSFAHIALLSFPPTTLRVSQITISSLTLCFALSSCFCCFTCCASIHRF